MTGQRPSLSAFSQSSGGSHIVVVNPVKGYIAEAKIKTFPDADWNSRPRSRSDNGIDAHGSGPRPLNLGTLMVVEVGLAVFEAQAFSPFGDSGFYLFCLGRCSVRFSFLYLWLLSALRPLLLRFVLLFFPRRRFAYRPGRLNAVALRNIAHFLLLLYQGE